MHTFVGKNKTRIHFNSDMSGECIIYNENGNNIKISCEDIIDFVAEYVRMEKEQVNNDFCEWRVGDYGDFWRPGCCDYEEYYLRGVRNFVFCPYCSKKVKVVE